MSQFPQFPWHFVKSARFHLNALLCVTMRKYDRYSHELKNKIPKLCKKMWKAIKCYINIRI